jgi:hypothetical protein
MISKILAYKEDKIMIHLRKYQKNKLNNTLNKVNKWRKRKEVK